MRMVDLVRRFAITRTESECVIARNGITAAGYFFIELAMSESSRTPPSRRPTNNTVYESVSNLLIRYNTKYTAFNHRFSC